MRAVRQAALAVTLAAMSTAAIAQTASLVLPQGTPVPLRNSYRLNIDEVKPGDRFHFHLGEHLKVGGVVIVPAGTGGVGEIVSARRNGGFGRAGRIETKALFIDYGGQRIELAGTPPPPRLTKEERRRLREERAREHRANGTDFTSTPIHTPNAASAAVAGLALVAATIVVTALIRGPKGTLEADAPLPGVVRRNTVVAPAGSPPPVVTAVAAAPPPLPQSPEKPRPQREAPAPRVVLTAI